MFFKSLVLIISLVVGYFFYFLNQQKIPTYPNLKNPAEFDNIILWPQNKKNEKIENLSKVIQFKTISYSEDKQEFQKVFNHLKERFPLIHSTLKLEKVGPVESLLYTWKGKSSTKGPLLFTAHIDVVPTPNPENWKFDPFSGKISDGFVYGRGTLDDKVNVMAIMEAVEELLKNNYQPERTIYLSFGCDEEVGGFQGAKVITDLLESRNVKLDLVHDEGGFVGDGLLPGFGAPIALISTTEKSFINVQLNVTCDPGHSSVPERESCIGILSKSILALENNQMASNVDNGIFKEFLRHVAPLSTFKVARFILGHTTLFSPLLSFALGSIKTSNALIRTTTAFTKFNSGVKDNVLPNTASANVNFRIHPNDNLEKLKKHIESNVDPRIQIKYEMVERMKQHPIGCIDCPPFQVIYKTIENIFPSFHIAPFLFVAGSDSAHYRRISKNSYGFTPFHITKNDVNKFHGFDERITEENYIQIIQYFYTVIKNADSNI
jgi:carboxypeptidase PM20D1